MQKYYISRNGTQEGPYDVSTISEMLRSGQLSASALAWQEGMANWLPIHQIPALSSSVTSNPYAASSTMAGYSQPAPYGMPQRTPGSATVSMIFGILAIILLLLIFFLAPFLGIVAVICGHVALGSIKRSQDQLGGKGQALAGLIMGYISVIGGIAITIGVFVLMKDVLTQAKTQTGSKSAEELLEKLKEESRTGYQPPPDEPNRR